MRTYCKLELVNEYFLFYHLFLQCNANSKESNRQIAAVQTHTISLKTKQAARNVTN